MRESLENLKEVGTIFQGSRFLADKVAREVNGINVVEYGAGIGAISKRILDYLPENGELICFEINKNFCKELIGIEDERLKVVNEDVRSLRNYVRGADCIVSGLPLALMKASRDEILKNSNDCRYIQYQYNPFSSEMYRKYFSSVKMKFEPRNIPPAFIYICENIKE